MIKKTDPIRIKYYKSLETGEKVSSIFFWISAFLSLLIITINKNTYPSFLENLQIFFILSVIIFSITTIIIKLYLSPQAQEHRYKDFLSHAFNIAHYEQTRGYYNNK